MTRSGSKTIQIRVKIAFTPVCSHSRASASAIVQTFPRDAVDPERPYLLIQRQFEDPDGGVCYVETHDETYIGHFRVRRIDFSPSRILLEIDRPKANVVEVTFAIGSSEFKRVARVVDIISGAIEAP